ncbi:MAG: hypothetical protein ACI83I_001743 [Bacteroidia bacterium]|jgi:hypothetical protein
MNKALILLIFLTSLNPLFAQVKWMAAFDQKLEKQDTFWNGSDSAGGFLAGEAFFVNEYNHDWQSWNGFSLSAMRDTSTAGFANQYSSITGTGYSRTSGYVVSSGGGKVVMTNRQQISGCYVNNATFAYLSMRDGDGFAKKFGGTVGTDPDFLLLHAFGISGKDTTKTSMYLADFQSDKSGEDYILKNWTYWNLDVLGDVDTILFAFSGSDTGQYGLNTPAYFCLDGFNATKMEFTSLPQFNSDFEELKLQKDTYLNGSKNEEGFNISDYHFVNTYNSKWDVWSGWSISTMTDTSDGSMSNQYSSVVGRGANNTQTYLTGYGEANVICPEQPDFICFTCTAVQEVSVEVANTKYAYETMKNGNAFAKKFGGDSGNDPDFLVLKIGGIDQDGIALDTIEFFLADYRFADNSKDYLINDWQYVELSPLFTQQRNVAQLHFWVEGSDTGQFGLNTPAYFCIDDFGLFTFGSPNERRLMLYPNPATSIVNIDTELKINQVWMTDLKGSIVQEMKQNSDHVIDISNCKSGFYILHVESNGKFMHSKIVKP